jgi:hypothetical protein
MPGARGAQKQAAFTSGRRRPKKKTSPVWAKVSLATHPLPPGPEVSLVLTTLAKRRRSELDGAAQATPLWRDRFFRNVSAFLHGRLPASTPPGLRLSMETIITGSADSHSSMLLIANIHFPFVLRAAQNAPVCIRDRGTKCVACMPCNFLEEGSSFGRPARAAAVGPSPRVIPRSSRRKPGISRSASETSPRAAGLASGCARQRGFRNAQQEEES